MNRNLLFVCFAMASLLLPGLSCQVFAQKQYTYGIDSLTAIYATKDNQDLGLDIFWPKQKKEPTAFVVYVHGGGFSAGRREGGHSFCKRVVERGMASATITYRLARKGKNFGCECPLPEKIEAIQIAVNDLRSAIKYCIAQRKKINIDTTKIVIIGSSAGAETVVHAAYWPNNTMNIDKQELSNDFKFAGVIPCAGALMDLHLITKESAIPTLLFHGTCDNLVPYATASHHYCPCDAPGWLMFFGGYSIAKKLKELDKTYQLFTFCGAGHGIAARPIRENFDDIMEFIDEAVIQQKEIQSHVIIREKDCDKFPVPGDVCKHLND